MLRSVMLAYPRSGSTWLRYCIEHCTGRPCPDLGGAAGHVFDVHGGTDDHITNDEPITSKVHRMNEIEDGYNVSVKLVLVVRSPFEVIPSFTCSDDGVVGDDVREYCAKMPSGKFGWYTGWYFENIIEAGRISEKAPVHIVYYEDLMEEPAETLGALVEFLGYPGSEKSFMERYDEHRATSFKLKSAHGGLPIQTGGALGNHFKSMLPDDVIKWLTADSTRFPTLHRYI
jgi:hypothetical protein